MRFGRARRQHAQGRDAIRRTVTAVAAVSFVLVGLWSGASAAEAADTPTQVDSVQFTGPTTFQDQSTRRLSVDWHATQSPAEPTVRVEFDIPSGLHGIPDTFSIGNGTCTVTAGHVSCVVDDAYVTANPLNVHGSFTIDVQVDLKNRAPVTRTFEIAGVVTQEVTVTSRYCTENCEYGGTGPYKWGSYNRANDLVTWAVGVPTVGDGIVSADGGRSLAPGQSVTVTDDFTAGGNPFTAVADPVVSVASCLVTDQWDRQSPAGWRQLAPDEYTVSSDRTQVTFTSAAAAACASGEQLTGSIYTVSWTVHADDGGKGVTGPGRYHNEASIAIGGRTLPVRADAVRSSNSGTVIGENFGRFALHKVFDLGTGMLAPQQVLVDYTIHYPGGVPADSTGTITLDATNGWSFHSDDIFVGSTVTLRERDPWSGNVTATSQLNGPGVTANPDGSFTFTSAHAEAELGYTLTNTAALHMQTLNARKAIDNPDRVTLPDGTVFALTASWPANPALFIAAGTASVELPADGVAVPFAGLPVGADVTFAEQAPDAVPGATWESSTVSPSTLTIAADTADVTVTATNVISRNVGSFTIGKELTGTASDLVTDRTFEVVYSYQANPELGIEAGEGIVDVVAGGEPATVTAPAGAVVTLSETPVKIEGGTWAVPEFAPGATFTVVQDQDVTIGLTNLITLDTGAFSVQKVLDGNAADRVPAGTEFTVHYSYPAGVGFAAGGGDLTVRAGETVTGPQLPYGASVALTEATPVAVHDATWSAPVFSATTVRIGDGTTVAVTLTNRITDPSLASTGGESGALIVPAALALIAAGVLATVVARRRRTSATRDQVADVV